MSLLDTAAQVIELAKKAGADSCDCVAARGTEFEVKVADGEIVTLTQATSKGLGLRVFVGGRLGFLRLRLGLLRPGLGLAHALLGLPSLAVALVVGGPLALDRGALGGGHPLPLELHEAAGPVALVLAHPAAAHLDVAHAGVRARIAGRGGQRAVVGLAGLRAQAARRGPLGQRHPSVHVRRRQPAGPLLVPASRSSCS